MFRKTFKPRDYLILSALIIIFSLVLILSLPQERGEESILLWSLFLAAIAPFLIVYLYTGITIDDNELTYRTVFHSRSIEFKNITGIETSARITGFSQQGMHARYDMILRSPEITITIAIKPYSKKALVELANTLVSKCSGAEINQTTREMAEGYMPSALGIKSKKGF